MCSALQVLAVNILGRFLLNNDRNIRSVRLSFPKFSSSFFLSPPHCRFSLCTPADGAAGTTALSAERCQPELTNQACRSSRGSAEGCSLSVSAHLFIGLSFLCVKQVSPGFTPLLFLARTFLLSPLQPRGCAGPSGFHQSAPWFLL